MDELISCSPKGEEENFCGRRLFPAERAGIEEMNGMKKIILGIITMILMAGVFIFVNQFYYPQSPIEDVTAKEILDKLNSSNEDVVEISKQADITWYVTKTGENGILDADEKIKEFLGSKGWTFREKNGSGLFFEKDGESLTVTTEMWTQKYVFVKVPANY
jgi:hypothetical protein